MAQRIVFGRRQVDFDGRMFTIEMRSDGIYVRRKHCRYEWKLGFDRLLNHAQRQPELIWDDKRQPEMFNPVDPGNQSQPLPDLQKGQLVPRVAEPVSVDLHASGEQPPQAVQERGDRVDTQPEGTAPEVQSEAGPVSAPAGNQLPQPDAGLGGTDKTGVGQ